MTTGWPLVKLGDVLRKSERTITLQPDTWYKEVTVRMNGNGVTERRQVKGIEIGSGRRYEALAGQFIISRIDARHGASGLIPDALAGAIVTNDFPLFDVVEDRLEPRFLHWVSKTGAFVALCKRASEGTTNRVRLSEDRFEALQVSLPPLHEQKRIVGRIEKFVSKISEAKALRAACAELGQTFVVSTHNTLATSKPEPLSNYLELHEEAVSIELGKPYPQVGVRGFGGGLFPKPPVMGGETTYRTFNRLYPGAIVLSQVKGWEGAVAVVPDHLDGYFVSPEYRTFKCKLDRCLPDYLASIVSTEFFWGRLKDATHGAGARRERTRPERFLQLGFSFPTLSDQRKAIAIFERLRAARELQAQTAIEIDAVLPAILDKAFRGEL